MKPIETFYRPAGSETTLTPAYHVRDLTESGDRAQLVLDDQVYTLRITRAGKLILTK